MSQHSEEVEIKKNMCTLLSFIGGIGTVDATWIFLLGKSSPFVTIFTHILVIFPTCKIAQEIYRIVELH